MTEAVSLADEFPQDGELIYLNHAGVAPWPQRSARAVAAFAEANAARGAEDYAQWLQREAQLRERLARLVDAASTDDIALIPNTSEGLSLIAYGVDWKPGDNVVINSEEFPSNRIVWESLAASHGVEIRDVDITAAEEPEAALIEALDGRTRLLPVSAVQYASGLRMDLARLGQACRANGTLFCVDAIQELGTRPMSARAIGADFLIADGHKWLLGPEGLGVLYVAPAARDTLALHRYGWHMVEAVGDYARKDWAPAGNARRFEAGSPNSLSIHALEASLSLIEEVGMTTIEHRILDLSAHLIEQLERLRGVQPVTPAAEARRAGIVTARLDISPEAVTEVYRQLRQRRILTAARGGGIRFSPHFYQDKACLDAALAELDALVSRQRT
jgi:selenocysteine lyase/cysteine desulfurase